MIIDLNCDLGEGVGNDSFIMPFISSANIACGFHAGGEKAINETIDLCIEHHVAIGAHPSFYDLKNFGREEQHLSADQIYDLIILQLRVMQKLSEWKGAVVNHVKPHGALYNMSAKDAVIAKAIARAVKDFNEQLILFGLSGSCSITEANAIGLRTASEVFADRTYQDNGSLTPRSESNAMIEDVNAAIDQAMQMIKEKTVTTVSGNKIPMVADTICIHGDGAHAVEFAKAIYKELKKNHIAIKAI